MRVLLLVLLATASVASAAPVAPGRQIVGSEQDHSLAGKEISDCEHFYRTTFTSFRAQQHAQEQREFSLADVDLLKVTLGEEGGVTVRGWNRPDARLIVCRYAAAHTKPHATSILGGIKVSHANGEISTSSGGRMQLRADAASAGDGADVVRVITG